jgi:hypothetical protein
MKETPESLSALGKTEVLSDRIKKWRADYEALKADAEKEAAAKANCEAWMAAENPSQAGRKNA